MQGLFVKLFSKTENIDGFLYDPARGFRRLKRSLLYNHAKKGAAADLSAAAP